jgi:hypothetical protein
LVTGTFPGSRYYDKVVWIMVWVEMPEKISWAEVYLLSNKIETSKKRKKISSGSRL